MKALWSPVRTRWELYRSPMTALRQPYESPTEALWSPMIALCKPYESPVRGPWRSYEGPATYGNLSARIPKRCLFRQYGAFSRVPLKGFLFLLRLSSRRSLKAAFYRNPKRNQNALRSIVSVGSSRTRLSLRTSKGKFYQLLKEACFEHLI